MSEPATEPSEFTNPSRLFEDARRAKQAHKEYLGSIFAPPEPELSDADAVLDELADRVAERLLTHLDQPEPEPQATGVEGQGGFDGGARASLPPPPESHDETLVRILRSRAADRGAAF